LLSVFDVKLLLLLLLYCCLVTGLGFKLVVDGEEIPLNEFASKILNGTMVGAVSSLRGVKKDWKEIEIRIAK